MKKYTFYNLEKEEQLEIEANGLFNAYEKFKKLIPFSNWDKWAMKTI